MTDLQKAILEVALEVKRVCEKNNINYSLAYGTLIGAIRHKGYIPWDDDIDFHILREDYEKFIKACKTDLNPKYALRSLNEGDYVYHFIKIDDTTTTLKEHYNKDKNYKGGVYVDIFPIDVAPQSKLKRAMFLRRIKYLRFRRNIACTDFTNKEYSLLKRIVIKIFQNSNARKYLLKLDKCYKKYRGKKTDYLVTTSYLFKKSLFEKYIECDFEGEKFSCFANYDEILTQIYGDYMQLPPEEKRISNHFTDVDLNKSYKAD